MERDEENETVELDHRRDTRRDKGSTLEAKAQGTLIHKIKQEVGKCIQGFTTGDLTQEDRALWEELNSHY